MCIIWKKGLNGMKHNVFRRGDPKKYLNTSAALKIIWMPLH